MPYPWNALEELTHDDLNAAIAFAASQGGGSYTLPIASTVALGGVKVDGATIAISGAGVISVVGGGGGGAVSSVAGRTGAVVLTHNDLTDWASATAAFVNAAQAAAAAPVQSVAGRTGAVVIASGDVSGLGGLATLAPAAQGAVLYSNGSAWATLAPGTAGQVLQSGGAGANPSWAAAGGGGASLALAQGALTFGAGATVNVSTGLTLTQPGLYTALNPSGLPAGLALSNGNATVTGVSNGSAAIVRGVDAVPGSAKYYFEFVPNWGSNSSSAAGIALASATASQANTGATGLAVAISNNFGATYLWLNGAHTISLGAFGSGVIGVAVDPVAGQIWARIGSGQWNASASANPATGVGGQSYGFTGAIYPVRRYCRDTRRKRGVQFRRLRGLCERAAGRVRQHPTRQPDHNRVSERGGAGHRASRYRHHGGIPDRAFLGAGDGPAATRRSTCSRAWPGRCSGSSSNRTPPAAGRSRSARPSCSAPRYPATRHPPRRTPATSCNSSMPAIRRGCWWPSPTVLECNHVLRP
jgi:hypothetical protein